MTTGQNAPTAELALQSDRIVATLERHRGTPQTPPTEGDARVICISGERGAGKTTLLSTVVKRLTSMREYIVLPVIRPEILATSDSLVLTAVSELVAHNSARCTTGEDNTDAVPLDTIGQQALRSAIYATNSSVRALYESSGSLGQFASDSAVVLRRAADYLEDFQKLVSSTLSATGASAVIAPIDDIDLAPQRLSTLLSDVRLLASCEGFIPVICLSPSDLRANLFAQTSQSLPTFKEDALLQIVDQQVMKTLRPDHVFEPLQLPESDRLGFRPSGATASLGELLAEVFTRLGGANDELAGWVRDTASSRLDSMNGSTWLPGNYRSLEHLYWEGHVLLGAIEQDLKGVEVAQRLLSFIGTMGRTGPQPFVRLDIHSVDAEGRSSRLRATAEWPALTLVVSTRGRWRRAVHEGGTRVSLRTAFRLVGHVAPTPNSLDRDMDDRRRLTSVELSAALAVQTLLSGRAFQEPRPTGPMSLIEKDCAFLQSVKVFGLPTNDRLLLFPASSGAVRAERWFRGWNWMVENSTDSTLRTARFDAVLAQLCRAVAQIWWLGADPARVTKSESFVGSLEEAAQLYVSLADTLADDSDWDTEPAKAYCEWFEALLPQAFHAALLSVPDLNAALETWQAAIATGPRGPRAIETLRQALEGWLEPDAGRVRGVDKSRIWLYGYRALVRNLGSDTAVRLNDFEKDYLERSSKGSKGRDAVEESVTLSESPGRYHFAARSTTEAKDQEAQILRLLDQLRQK